MAPCTLPIPPHVVPMESDLSLWGQIKQRRVTQIVLTYLASGWMALAVVDQVVDREVLPGVVYRVTLTLYIFGIGAALVLGWYHGEKGEQQPTVPEILLLSVFALGGFAMSAQIIRNYVRDVSVASALVSSTMDLRRLAVLYFEDETTDGSLAAVADALTEGLIRSLAQVRELDIVSRNGSESVRGAGLSLDSIASIFAAGTLIEGRVDQVGDELRVSVTLVDGQSGVTVQRDRYDWPMDDLASVGDALAREVSRTLRIVLGEEIRLRESRSGAPSTAAWLHLARAEKALKDGLSAVQRGDDERADLEFTAADEELVAARVVDSEWVTPVALSARVAYERNQLATTFEELQEVLERGVALADEALAIEPNNAAALEVRGTARYRLWLFELAEEDALDVLLEAAQADLERSFSLDRSRANVNSVLSHLYYQVGDWSRAVLAARQAYEGDAFLTVADDVLRRLYLASYDLGQYEEASRWCLEGGRRFPDNFRFTQCRLYLMTMERAVPDVDEAWALYEEFESLLPESQRPLLSGLGLTFLGGVIGRAGLPDSADAVMIRARVDQDVDPGGEQISMEAAMRSVIGDVDGAIESLERFMILNPGHFPDEHWWWRNLEGNRDFERLQAIR